MVRPRQSARTRRTRQEHTSQGTNTVISVTTSWNVSSNVSLIIADASFTASHKLAVSPFNSASPATSAVASVLIRTPRARRPLAGSDQPEPIRIPPVATSARGSARAHDHGEQRGGVGEPPQSRREGGAPRANPCRAKSRRQRQQQPRAKAGADVEEHFDHQRRGGDDEHDPGELIDEVVDRPEQGRGLGGRLDEHGVAGHRDLLGEGKDGIDRLGDREGRGSAVAIPLATSSAGASRSGESTGRDSQSKTWKTLNAAASARPSGRRRPEPLPGGRGGQSPALCRGRRLRTP